MDVSMKANAFLKNTEDIPVLIASLLILFIFFMSNVYPYIEKLVVDLPKVNLVLLFILITVLSTLIIYKIKWKKSVKLPSCSLIESDVGLVNLNNEAYLVQFFKINFKEVAKIEVTHSFFDFLFKSGLNIRILTDIHKRNDIKKFSTLLMIYERTRVMSKEALEQIRKNSDSIFVASKVYHELFELTKISGEELLKCINFYFLNESELDDKNYTEDSLPKSISTVLPSLSYPKNYTEGALLQTREKMVEGITIGKQLYDGEVYDNFVINVDDLFRHSIIVGVTGSGKTNTNKVILSELHKKGYRFLLFDFHDEYNSNFLNLTNAIEFRFDGGKSINFLEPFEMTDFASHVSIITDVFDSVYSFSPSQLYVFREVLESSLTYAKINKSKITLREVVNNLESYEPKSFYENETKYSLLRRLKPLCEGEGSKVFEAKNLIGINKILENNIVFKISDIKDSDIRRLFVSLTLACIYEYRFINGPDKIGHFISLEEAQNFVPYRNRTEKQSIYEKMFFEMRKYKEAFILIAQFPSQIYPDVIKSSEVKIVHRLFSAGDAEIVSDVLGISEKIMDQLKSLPTGRALVFLSTMKYPATVQIFQG